MPSIAIPASTYPALDAEAEFAQIQLVCSSWLQSKLDVTLTKRDNKQYRLPDVLNVWLERGENRASIKANREAARAKSEARLQRFAAMREALVAS